MREVRKLPKYDCNFLKKCCPHERPLGGQSISSSATTLIPRIIQMRSPERPQHLPHQDESGKAGGVTDIPLPAGTWLCLAPPRKAHLGGSIGAGDRGVDPQ